MSTRTFLSVATVLLLIVSPPAAATDYVWLSAADGPWSDPLHIRWSPSTGFPSSAADNATIGATGADYFVNLDTNVLVNNFSMTSSDASMTTAGFGFNTAGAAVLDRGVFFLANSSWSGGTLTNNLTSANGDGFTVLGNSSISMATLDQDGLLLIIGSDTFGNATLNISGNATNHGDIIVTSDAFGSPHAAALNAGSAFTNLGTIEFGTGGGGARALTGAITGGTIKGSATVDTNGTLDGVTLDGTVNVQVGDGVDTILKNTITNNATISLNRTDSFTAQLLIDGAVTLGGTGQVVFATNAANNNLISVGTGSNPMLTIGPNQTVAAPINTAGTISGNMINQGQIVVDGTIQRPSGTLSNALGGIISGSGTLNLSGSNLSNQGTVAPGSSAGTLTMNGNFTQESGGTFAVELGGTAGGTFDKLVVNGTAFLDGELNVSLIGGFVPNINDTFTILTANTVINTDGLLMTAADDPYYDLIFNPTSVVLQVVAVPPPAGVPGDYNGNSVVDAADYTVWRDMLGQTGPGLAADGDYNNLIDSRDYNFWKAHFGQTAGIGSADFGELSRAGASPSHVPEPASTLWMVLAALAVTPTLSRRASVRTQRKL